MAAFLNALGTGIGGFMAGFDQQQKSMLQLKALQQQIKTQQLEQQQKQQEQQANAAGFKAALGMPTGIGGAGGGLPGGSAPQPPMPGQPSQPLAAAGSPPNPYAPRLQAPAAGQPQQPATPPTGPPTPLVPTGNGGGGGMPWEQFEPIMRRYESGNQNIPNAQHSGATGYDQITGQTWRETAPRVGVDTKQYPTAMSAPEPTQSNVGGELYRERGSQPWTAFNSKLATAINAKPPAEAAQVTAQQAAQQIPQQVWGQTSIQSLAQAIEKANPEADPAVKFLALQKMATLAAPEQRAQLQMTLMQNREELQIALKDATIQNQQNMLTQRLTSGAATKGWSLGTVNGQTVRINADTGEVKPIESAQGLTKLPAAAAGGGAGDQKSVDAVAGMIAHYNMAPLSGWSLRTPWGQQVLAKIQDINPQYDATRFTARQTGARALEAGRQGDAVRSASVAIDHLDVAEQLSQALQNGDTRALNNVQQTLAAQFGSDVPTNFNTAKEIVGDEVNKFVLGGQGTLSDREALKANFDKASSPEQLAGTIGTLKRLMAGQVQGYRRQFGNVMQPDQFNQLLSPDAQKLLEMQSGNPAGGNPAGGNPAGGDMPTAVGPDGKTIHYNGTAWVDETGNPVQ